MFNGYSQVLISRYTSSLNEDIVDPELSLSVYYGPTNSTRPFDKFTLNTVDDTMVYSNTVYPLTSVHYLQKYVRKVGLISSVLKIWEPPIRITKFQLGFSMDLTLDGLDELYFKVGFKDNVTTLIGVYRVTHYSTSTNTLNAHIFQVNSKVTLLSNSSIYNFISLPAPSSFSVPPDIHSTDIFDFNYIGNLDFVFSDLFSRYSMPFPFGLLGRRYQDLYLQSITVFIPRNVSIYSVTSTEGSSTIYPQNTTKDDDPPRITDFEIINFDYITNVYRISVTDQIGFGVLQSISILKQAKDSIVEGTIQNGVFEFIVDIKDIMENYFTFNLIDLNRNSKQYGRTYYDPYSSFQPAKILNFKLQDISYFDFKYHTMDTSESEAINYLFFNLTGGFDRTMTPLLQINYKGSFSNQDFNSFQFTGYWDSNLEVFIIPFYLPRKFFNGYLMYQLTNSLSIFNNFLYPIFGPKSQVFVTTNESDLLAPVISNYKIFEPNTVDGITTMGWTVTIIDEINGFSNGYFEVISNLDWVPMKLEINETNRIY
eukprot:gene12457-15215_t